jgi:hypothetical protein
MTENDKSARNYIGWNHESHVGRSEVQLTAIILREKTGIQSAKVVVARVRSPVLAPG